MAANSAEQVLEFLAVVNPDETLSAPEVVISSDTSLLLTPNFQI